MWMWQRRTRARWRSWQHLGSQLSTQSWRAAIYSLGPLNGSAVSFLGGLGQRITKVSGENRQGSFFFQQLSVLIQRFNAVLLHDCFVNEVAGSSS